MTRGSKAYHMVPGTCVFDGKQSATAYPLNKSFFSFNLAENPHALRPSWLVMRGALTDGVKGIHKPYHAPISNTGAGVLLLENMC